MFGKKVAETGKADTVVGKSIVLEDVKIRGIGTVRIDGIVNGKIDLEGNIVISPGGKLEGEVNAAGATIAGYYKGEMNINGTLHIMPEAIVTGRLTSNKMVVDEGASISAAIFANDNAKLPKERENKDENWEEAEVSVGVAAARITIAK